MTTAYARLHILLARDARVGLVIRHWAARESVCTLLWDRKKDKFTLGQWMGGRIDTKTCDLSPDGGHFIYAVRKYLRTGSGPESWTAVSRTPYLKALAWYRWRSQGGWFVSNHQYCAPGSFGLEDRESPEVRRVEPDGDRPASLYANRLVRGGWSIEREGVGGDVTLVRPAGSGWELRHEGRRGYRLTRGDLAEDTRGWDWADLDRRRLVWTVKGCLWEGVTSKDGLRQTRMVHDFNPMKFEALAAPYEGGRLVDPVSAPAAPVRKVVPRARPRKPVHPKPDRSKVLPEDDDAPKNRHRL